MTIKNTSTISLTIHELVFTQLLIFGKPSWR
jgi:hypothetical protein